MYADTVRPSLRAAFMMAACWAGVTRMLMFLSFNFGSLVMAVRGRGLVSREVFFERGIPPQCGTRSAGGTPFLQHQATNPI